MSIREKIENEIRQRGPISFSRYMELCLYDPIDGYYLRSAEQFGKTGDFYTSSDVHAVFGRLLARQFEEMWQALGQPAQIEILELGPGRGLFARDVLDWSRKKFHGFFAALTYTLQESSPALRAKLHDTLRDQIDIGKAKVPEGGPTSLHRSLAPEVPLIFFANEFFDALPVDILSPQGKLHLVLENKRLCEIWLPAFAEELEFLDRHSIRPKGSERVEVCLAAQQWVNQIARSIPRGFLAVIDYGYMRNQQVAGRHCDTVLAYRHHVASSDLYEAPGEQDLTAHVNFTAISDACEQAGMKAEKLLTQSQFLLGVGEKTQFADAFEECRLPQEQARVALQLKQLVTPAGMGESFQVLIGSRNVGPKELARLSGLSFLAR